MVFVARLPSVRRFGWRTSTTSRPRRSPRGSVELSRPTPPDRRTDGAGYDSFMRWSNRYWAEKRLQSLLNRLDGGRVIIQEQHRYGGLRRRRYRHGAPTASCCSRCWRQCRAISDSVSCRLSGCPDRQLRTGGTPLRPIAGENRGAEHRFSLSRGWQRIRGRGDLHHEEPFAI